MKKYTICSALAMALLPSFVLGEVHDLGVITVESNASNTQKNMFESMVSSKDISLQNTATVGEALGNMSGISETVVGARGESGINIRGFDAKRVGIFIDGIPVYVPYDGNFDFARFLSGDISRIDVSKGFSSVMFGGNTMGGAVNIVSKKTTKDFEGSIKTGIVFDNDGDKSSQTTSLNLGTKQDNFYAQLNAQ
jgi:iron complex outermembrane receptor protein